jgi:cyanobactin maturation PatA/PatG family protease
MTLGDERIRIAVLDGPVDRAHSAFEGARLTEFSVGSSVPGIRPGVATEHGTHVASLIFGQHHTPVKGIAPHCSGLVIPVFADSHSGTLVQCSQADLARALIAAVDQGANIINISGGEFSPSGRADAVLASALERCDREGVLVVAAAGNDGCDCLHVPAAHPSILAVGASTATGEPLQSSNWGSQYQGHSILAPGEKVRGALPGGTIAERSGTSAATAIVSGVAGLLMSLHLARGIAPNGPRIRRLLLESADPCPSMLPSTCRRYLSGVLNVDRAVSLISKKDPTMKLNEPSPHLQPNAADIALSESGEISQATTSSPKVRLGQMPLGSTVMGDQMVGVSGVQTTESDLVPSSCGCDGGAPRGTQLVFAIGQIGYSFSSQARLDSLRHHMFDEDKNKTPDPSDQNQLLYYLERHPWDATSVIWTLEIETVPVYAISVAGPNSAHVFKHLSEFLMGQAKYQAALDKPKGLTKLTEAEVERVSIAGVLGGQIRLMTGELIPVIHPEVRGMNAWNTPTFAARCAHVEVPGSEARSAAKAKSHLEAKTKVVQQFLERVYFDFRNLGLTARDRAVNYAGTNPSDFTKAFAEAADNEMKLHTIEVIPSLLCRPGSECWDVRLEYFDPKQYTAAVRHVYRMTIDVSDVVPVAVYKPLYWSSAD